ncbi:MAG: hypothetical protein U5K54_25615 [Cytophagales bacterium]|nr:hypothetical protein [Cytophagales bacterium]
MSKRLSTIRLDDTPVYYKPLESEREVVNYLKGSLIIGMADSRRRKQNGLAITCDRLYGKQS